MIKLSENKIESPEIARTTDYRDLGMAIPFIATVALLPGSPPQPCPELLTETEAIKYLRLDDDPNAARTLRYYRDKGVLFGTQVGRHLFYRRVELELFLERQTQSSKIEGTLSGHQNFRPTGRQRKAG